MPAVEPSLLRSQIAVPGVGELPVLSLDSGRPGPVAVVTANLHGDECVGVAVVHRLRAELPRRLLCGRVHLYPSLNPGGLREVSRGLPGDERDPNRLFPGDARGSMAERLVAAIWADLLARQPELLIDLHSDASRSIPYVILDRVCRGPHRRRLDERCLQLARASGLTVLREYPRPRYLRYNLDRSLPGALVNGPGVAAVTIEAGPRRSIDPQAVEISLRATLGVLHAAGLVDAPAPVDPSRLGGGPWRRESGPRCAQDGVLEVLPPPGQIFPAGTLLARLRSLDGRMLQELSAPEAGFVVAVPDRGWITAGSAVATLAVREA